MESKDDVRAKDILENTIKVDGRFQAKLLWKGENISLPDSYNMSINRLRNTERKMDKDIEFGAAYKEIINSYICKGYVLKLSHPEIVADHPRKWYLPHFGVANPNKPGKLRIVFDAAATVEGVSLNSQLLKGPQQYRPLPPVLFNFRIGVVGVCGDIREMFHQILVAPEDRAPQRFLWRNQKDDLPIFEMMVMTFGAACSPCVAQNVKEKNALQYKEKYPRAVKSILDHHYVDDFVDSFASSEKAIEVSKQVCEIHAHAGFELRNFSSNSPEVVLALSGKLGEPVNFNTGPEEFQSEKVLGMYWQPKDDTFKFRIKCHKVNTDVLEGRRWPTKRELLSVVMSIFGPLGFLSNFLISAKLLMREVWRHDIRWDETIPETLVATWNSWREDLQNLKVVSIPRCYFKTNTPLQLELHVFVDASENAFGAVSYWRSISADRNISVSFVAAKTKCAPLKVMAIPRLELQAAVMGTRLLDTIMQEHALKVCRFVCWSDSTTVLSWIGSSNRRYKPFVAHSVTEILAPTSPTNWRWVPTNLNVADQTTRMKHKVDFDFNSRWFKGPEFLYENESSWPKATTKDTLGPFEEELPPKVIVLTGSTSIFDYSRFSSFLTLKRTVAWVLRFSKRCRKRKHPNEQNGLKADELKSAEMLICREAQKDKFLQEINILKNNEKLQKGSELYKLCPYIAKNSLLRVYGRISAASWLPLESRHPIILPSSHPVTELYVTYIHNKMKHQNFEATIGEIRRRFWIPRLRNVLRKCIANCYFCRFRQVEPIPPLMGSLPEDRVTPYVRPFETFRNCFRPFYRCLYYCH
ncbi:uncharacterized protein LOC142240968 [Haematobia irritans]|uniref:uncharacterized protein LOC142240968 n=1 Tax=Haematobia irritans TaxID=7368 RepID=UPI003F5054A1